MPKISDYDEWYSEADEKHSKWLESAKQEWDFYNGDQWDTDTKSKLQRQQRPVLTLNYSRRIVRLLVGYEMKTRYNQKVYPLGEQGDDPVSKLWSRLLKYVQTNQEADQIYSLCNKYGLITGRGWVGTGINRDENIFGDIELTNPDPYRMLVDPYGKRLDLTDHKYQIEEVYMEIDRVKHLYPEYEKEIENMPTDTEFATETFGGRTNYRVRTFYYYDYKKHSYLVDYRNHEKYLLKDKDAIEEAREQADGMTMDVISTITPEVKYAVLCGDVLLEEDYAPYNHRYYPNVPYFCEFIPSFGDRDADWVSVMRDIIDPQKEINKRRSEWLDILLRVVNTGYVYEDGVVLNEHKLKELGVKPGVEIKLRQNGFALFREKVSGQPSPELFRAGATNIEEMLQILGINPAMLGIETSSREPAKAMQARVQQGNVMVAPFLDNLRQTKKTTAKIILSLIPQVFKPSRIARIISADENSQLSPEDMQAIQRMLEDIKVGKYDVEVSDAPQTPTQRIAEFAELKEMIEMMGAYGMPPTPGMLTALVNASDISLKREVQQELQNMAQQAQQQQQQQQQPWSLV